MRKGLGKLAIFGITAAVALKLFAFGLSYPQAMRIRGDAYVYLAIANSFDSFSAAFAYVGERTAGMPLFDFAMRKLLWLFTPTNQVLPWADAVCVALLGIHVVTAWCFSRWIATTGIVRSETAPYLLFAFLATYPALVGHTTSPLSDTLAIDLILCGGVLLGKGLDAQRLPKALLLSLVAGLLLGLSILVRSGSLPAIAAGLVAATAASLFGGRYKTACMAAAAAGCLLMLAPNLASCAQKTGSFCLQSPSFPAIKSAQAGLLGARTLWMSNPTGEELPTLVDETMAEHFFNRCELNSIAGFDTSSLTGCLASRPLAVPAYLVKKWIGLFDHFRFTPYLERATPFWLVWLSRAYDSLAWIGFALSFAALAQLARRHRWPAAKRFATTNIAAVMLVVYAAVMLAVHTALHVEDRYGFPLLPLCAVVLLVYGEKGLQALRAGQAARLVPLTLFCLLALGVFLAQIIAWDRLSGY